MTGFRIFLWGQCIFLSGSGEQPGRWESCVDCVGVKVVYMGIVLLEVELVGFVLREGCFERGH